ncbi:hypothetical protein [Streptomyces marincola]|uniref:hypothetical protein n=1 Tax=Streptomyces marincola TaxID=2878388 RepID=UPI001CF11B4B|nr:hypothetical protein [Streptomyces marincola]UCM86937.1 hypothetical protein LC193_02725 [Streptomyces marincola]
MSDYAPLRGLVKLGPWDAIPLSAAGEQLAVLARRVADSREEIALTDEDGAIVAVVISPSKLEDLEEELALTRNEIDRRDGKEPISHEDLVAKLRSDE